MTLFKLILRNLWFYRWKNLLLALGISISAAIITGALLVGDSVKFSLNSIVSDRLGKITHVVKTQDRYFSISLAKNLEDKLKTPVSPALLSRGMAVAGGGDRRINQVQILGVEPGFNRFSNTDAFYDQLTSDRIIISENLAARLGVAAGDMILLRITRESLVPMNAPFVSDQENTVSFRAEIADIAGRNRMGMFNLENTQTAPFNVFISLEALNNLMEFEQKANLLLMNVRESLTPDDIMNQMEQEWELRDAALMIEKISDGEELQVSSERVFIEEQTSNVLKKLNGLNSPVLSYFVNRLSSGDKNTPYSFVSTLPDSMLRPGEVIINSWLAEDLDAKPGDSLEMKYYVIGPLRQLIEKEASFIIRSVKEMRGIYADRDLMPHIPGLSDAGNCRDWETGIPIDLESIRDKDEKYWDEWGGTPKAFISLSTATRIWENRFGKYTAFRYDASQTDPDKLASNILSGLSPADLGFMAENVQEEAKYAAQNGVNFSQLFAGLSFFLLAAGIALSLLLLLLNLEIRKEQLSTLSDFGIPGKKIFRMMFLEGSLISIAGALIGLVLAILYTQGVFTALNSVWQDIVRTEMMVVQINMLTLVKGFIISLLVSLAAIFFPLHRFLKKQGSAARKKIQSISSVRSRKINIMLIILPGLVAIILILLQLIRQEAENAQIFFVAGGLLLISGIALARYLLINLSKKTFVSLEPYHLSIKNAFRNPSRSMTIVILFSLATFMVVSTGSNRKDLFINADDPASGTGGFLYYGESTVPVLHNLNKPEKRYEYGFSKGYSFVQFRRSQGDDASCLNLNKVMNPGIIATDPRKLAGRFSFATSTDILDEANPWMTLNDTLPGNLIPAIADQTVIKWGMGMKVGDTLVYKNAMGENMKLLLVGGLAPSIFQGRVIISEKYFLKNYPQNSGTSVFLIDGNPDDNTLIEQEISQGLRDYGINLTLSAKRLAEFNSVTNTYLSIFLVLGALGLLLGTIGLGIVLFKSVLERSQEIALMKAVGIHKKMIKKIVNREYIYLLFAGTGIGFITAIIATLPSILSPNTEVSIYTLLVLVLIITGNGWLWSTIMTGQSLRNKKVYEALRNE